MMLRLAVAAVLALAAAEVLAAPPARCAVIDYEGLHEVSHADWALRYEAALAGQIMQESSCRKNARSAYAAGLAQFTPATAGDMRRWYPAHLAEGEVYDVAWALTAQTFYMSRLADRVDAADDCERFAFVLSAYNGGLGWTIRDKRAAARHGADPHVWFGQVEKYWDRRRAPANVQENHEYPLRILVRWAPEFMTEHRKNACSAAQLSRAEWH